MQNPDHGSSKPLIRVNIKIKIIIIIVSIPTWESNHDKAQISGRESHHWLNEVNVWIKFVIIIFLKPDLEVVQGKDLDYRSKGSTKVNQIKKKNNQSNLVLTKKNSKNKSQ